MSSIQNALQAKLAEQAANQQANPSPPAVLISAEQAAQNSATSTSAVLDMREPGFYVAAHPFVFRQNGLVIAPVNGKYEPKSQEEFDLLLFHASKGNCDAVTPRFESVKS